MAIVRSRLLLGLLALVLVASACGGSSGKSEGSSAGPPAFTAAELTGGELSSASFAGKPTALWFWAPWCTVCRREAPDVAAAAAQFEGKVDFVGVAGRGEVPAMKKFVKQTGTGGFTHVVDATGSIWTDYGVSVQPAFAFIDAKGNVDTHIGALSPKELTKRLEELSAA